MAELTEPTSSCCAPAEQATCCEPDDKAACCGAPAAGDGCGCAAGRRPEPQTSDIREVVRDRYAAAALAIADHQDASCGCGPVSHD